MPAKGISRLWYLFGCVLLLLAGCNSGKDGHGGEADSGAAPSSVDSSVPLLAVNEVLEEPPHLAVDGVDVPILSSYWYQPDAHEVKEKRPESISAVEMPRVQVTGNAVTVSMSSDALPLMLEVSYSDSIDQDSEASVERYAGESCQTGNGECGWEPVGDRFVKTVTVPEQARFVLLQLFYPQDPSRDEEVEGPFSNSASYGFMVDR